MCQRTFDQMLDADSPPSGNDEIQPHSIVDATLVFEPMQLASGTHPAKPYVRITARTKCFRLLWGTTASEESLKLHPAQVAFYGELKREAGKHLSMGASSNGADDIQESLRLLAALESRIQNLRKSLQPKKVTDKTRQRASRLIPSIRDAAILLDAGGEEQADS